MDSRNLIIAMAIHYAGNWKEMFNALTKKEYLSEEVAINYLKQIKSKVVTILDADYPRYLKEGPYPPFVLFYYGDLSLISDMNNNVAVVGSRDASCDGIKNTSYIVSGIAKKYNIVSGLARGIDSVAHWSAIHSGGKTIAVLGSGIDYCYPASNDELYSIIKDKHLLISEYSGTINPLGENFYQRNRLIVLLSKGTILGEAKEHSGSLMTANLTMSYFKELMCIPSSDIYNSFCDVLIRDGCPVILSPEDVINVLEKHEKSLLGNVK